MASFGRGMDGRSTLILGDCPFVGEDIAALSLVSLRFLHWCLDQRGWPLL